MYAFLLSLHSLLRWSLLFFLVVAICCALKGLWLRKPFSKFDNAVRHWTATVAHVQLIVGVLLYVKSPIIQYFWSNVNEHFQIKELTFFGIFHILMMLIAVLIITIGSAMAKRKSTDVSKFSTMLIWYLVSLIIILILIPWPFSPFAQRPFFRSF